MSIVFKSIDPDSRNVRKFYVHKSYAVTSANSASLGLIISVGVSGLSGSYIRSNSNASLGPTNLDGTYQWCLFNSMKQMYYATNSLAVADYFGQQKVDWTNVHRIAVVGFSQHTFGQAIMPSTLTMTDNTSGVTIVDDGYGNLRFTTPVTLTLGGLTNSYTTESVVGNVFYEHGIALVLTSSAGYLFTDSDFSITYKNTVPIQEHEYMCTVKAGELNVTTNPSAYGFNGPYASGSKFYPTQSLGVNFFATHSQFTPYITTIGLYNDVGELLAVSRMSRPIKSIPYLDYTFVTRFDA